MVCRTDESNGAAVLGDITSDSSCPSFFSLPDPARVMVCVMKRGLGCFELPCRSGKSHEDSKARKARQGREWWRGGLRDGREMGLGLDWTQKCHQPDRYRSTDNHQSQVTVLGGHSDATTTNCLVAFHAPLIR